MCAPTFLQNQDTAAMMALCAAALTPTAENDPSVERAITPEPQQVSFQDGSNPQTPISARMASQLVRRDTRCTTARSLRSSNLKRMRTSYRMVEEVLDDVHVTECSNNVGVVVQSAPIPTPFCATVGNLSLSTESCGTAVISSSITEGSGVTSCASNLKRMRTSYQLVASTLQETCTIAGHAVGLCDTSHGSTETSIYGAATPQPLRSTQVTHPGGSNLKRMRTSNRIVGSILEEAQSSIIQSGHATSKDNLWNAAVADCLPIAKTAADSHEDVAVYSPLRFSFSLRSAASFGTTPELTIPILTTQAAPQNKVLAKPHQKHAQQQPRSSEAQRNRSGEQEITGGGPITYYLRRTQANACATDNHYNECVPPSSRRGRPFITSSTSSPPHGGILNLNRATKEVSLPTSSSHVGRTTQYHRRIMVQSSTTRAGSGIVPAAAILTLRHGARATGVRVTAWVAPAVRRVRTRATTSVAACEGQCRGMCNASRWSAGHSTRARLKYVFA